MDLVSAPPAVEALLLFVEVQSLAGSAPSSDTPAAYATFAQDVLSALERLEVLAEPAHPKSTAEALFLSKYVSKLQQAVTTNDLPARQVAQTFYANVPKPTVTNFFQAVEAARLAHTAADTAQLEAAMAALFSGPASSTGVRFPKKTQVSKQGDHSYCRRV